MDCFNKNKWLTFKLHLTGITHRLPIGSFEVGFISSQRNLLTLTDNSEYYKCKIKDKKMLFSIFFGFPSNIGECFCSFCVCFNRLKNICCTSFTLGFQSPFIRRENRFSNTSSSKYRKPIEIQLKVSFIPFLLPYISCFFKSKVNIEFSLNVMFNNKWVFFISRNVYKRGKITKSLV